MPPVEAVTKAETAVFAETISASASGRTEFMKRPEAVPPSVPEVAKAATPLAPKPVERDISQSPETVSNKADFPRSAGLETPQAALLPPIAAPATGPVNGIAEPAPWLAPVASSLESPVAEPERAGLGQAMPPARSNKSPLVLVVGLIVLAVFGGVGYYFYARAKAVPPPSVAPVAPTLTIPEPVPSPSIAVPETPAPPPEAVESTTPAPPSPKPVKAPKVKAVKAPVPAPKVPAPAPAPVVVAPPPTPAVAAPPPAPELDAKAKRKALAAEATKKRLEAEDRSK